MLVRVETSHRVGGHLLISVSEVDVPHVILVMKKIRIQSIVVPEVVLVVLTFPMTLDHEVHKLSHPICDVSPEQWSQRKEVRIDWA